jgi:hypothetical protein
MSDHNTLQKAIDRAIANGWYGHLDHSDTGTWLVVGNLHTRIDGPMPKDVFYSHDFARALWGTDEQEGQHLAETENYYAFEAAEDVTYDGPKWKLHLMNMVISDDPIAYLGEHL